MRLRSQRDGGKQLLVSLLVVNGLCLAACCNPDSIRTPSLPEGIVGQPYSFHLEHNCFEQTLGIGPEWRVSDTLPPGMGLSRIGQLDGTPTSPGSYSFLVSLVAAQTDGTVTNVLDSRNFSFVVRPAP